MYFPPPFPPLPADNQYFYSQSLPQGSPSVEDHINSSKCSFSGICQFLFFASVAHGQKVVPRFSFHSLRRGDVDTLSFFLPSFSLYSGSLFLFPPFFMTRHWLSPGQSRFFSSTKSFFEFPRPSFLLAQSYLFLRVPPVTSSIPPFLLRRRFSFASASARLPPCFEFPPLLE